MIHKTRGIVLRTVNYSESSIVVKIFTEEFGLQSYLIKGAKRKKTPIRANLFQPLSLLELIVYKKEGNKLQSIKEAGIETHFNNMPVNPSKLSIYFFINEVLVKCLQEQETNKKLFAFLHETIQLLDTQDKDFNNLHLIFLVQLSRYLGFFPQGIFSDTTMHFDLREGKFLGKEPLHPDFLSKSSAQRLSKLVACNYYSMNDLKLTSEERRNLLDVLLRFYELHLSNLGNIASLPVLKQLLL